MVEFAVKLADNKVAEWNHHYVSYDALKKILKKAKSAQEKCNRLASKKTTEEGYEVLGNERRDEDDDAFSVDTSLPTVYSQDDRSIATEDTMLLQRSRKSEHDMVGGGFSVKHALGNISGIFSLDIESRNARRLDKALKNLDDQILAFDELFYRDQKKVRSFYYDTLRDLEDKLEFVKSSVTKAFGVDVVENDGVRNASPFVTEKKQHRKALSMDDVMEGLLQSVVGDDIGTRNRPRKRFDKGNPNERRERHTPTPERPPRILVENYDDSQHRSPRIHERRVTNIQLGHLLQDVGDDEEFHFQSANANDGVNARRKLELLEQRAADAAMIKRFLVSQYRLAKYLHNFAMMNITGFVKIAKKFDKTIPSHAGRFQSALEARNMMDDAAEVETLEKKYETYYANWFCEGDIRAAKVQLLSKQKDGLALDWSQLILGYRMGICAVLAVWVSWDCIWGMVQNGSSTIGQRTAFPIFRACGGLLLFQWYWACSVFVWTRYRINYIFLFDIIPSTASEAFDLFRAAVDSTLIFMLLMLLYYKAGAHAIPHVIPTEMYPLILMLVTLYKLFFPLRKRHPMWQTVYKVLTSGVRTPTFFHTFIGDFFTSMVKVFQDIVWSICWLLAGSFLATEDSALNANWITNRFYKNVISFVTIYPLIIRFNQCFRKFYDTGDRIPHLANAGKYALASLVTLFGIFHPLSLDYNSGRELEWFQIFWTMAFVASSIYSYCWDVFMDWGLGRKNASYLNKVLMYPWKSYYYVAIVIDLFLRFLWVLTLVPPDSGASFALPQYLTALSMMLELSRRTMWGFMRLENEHRTNERSYRRKGFVPLHFNTDHLHKYQEKGGRAGSDVLREVLLVTVVLAVFCFGTIIAAQHENERLLSFSTTKEL